VITCSFQTLTPYGSGNSRRIFELHTFLATLIRQFDFALPDDAPKIGIRRPVTIMPVVEGEEHKGARLPLKVTSLKNE
jgi:hypothetical protein